MVLTTTFKDLVILAIRRKIDNALAGTGEWTHLDIGQGGKTYERINNTVLDNPILGAGSRKALTWNWVGNTGTAVITLTEAEANGTRIVEVGIFNGDAGASELQYRKACYPRGSFIRKKAGYRVRFTITLKVSCNETY